MLFNHKRADFWFPNFGFKVDMERKFLFSHMKVHEKQE